MRRSTPSELRDTLCVYIGEQFSAARALCTHRNTVLNRQVTRMFASRFVISPGFSEVHGTRLPRSWKMPHILRRDLVGLRPGGIRSYLLANSSRLVVFVPRLVELPLAALAIRSVSGLGSSQPVRL